MRYLLLFTLLLIQSLVSNNTLAHGDSTHLEGHLYVKVENSSNIRLDSPNTPLPLFDSIKQNYGVKEITRPFTGLNDKLDRTYELQFDTTDQIFDLKLELEALNYIQYVEEVPVHFKHHKPNDLQNEQDYLNQINAKKAWNKSKGSGNVVIAVVDNAVFTRHEDLEGDIWTNESEQNGMQGIDDDFNGYTDDTIGYDVADDNPNPNPPEGITEESGFVHGTHVAGIAGASTNNNKGIASIGYNCSIMSVKCSPDSSDGRTLPHAYDGVYYAIRSNADVINMSWGGPNMTLTGSNLFETAESNDIVLIASGGNADTDEKSYPAAYEEVMAVGATDGNDQKAGFSNYGNWIDVMAPGSQILSALAGTKSSYGKLSGTSMSAPLVSGLAGLILSRDSEKSKQAVEADILEGADNIDGQNSQYAGKLGKGRINAYQSVAESTTLEPESNDRKWLVYPNPASGEISLEVKQPIETPLNVRLINLKGKEVINKKAYIQNSGNTKTIQLTDVKPGVYNMILSNKEKKWTKEVILE